MRKVVAWLLRWQSKRLIARVQPKIIVVVGSVGKTSTTQAIATTLSAKYTVRSTIGNYNTDVGVPCSLFQTKLPRRVSSIRDWVGLFIKHEGIIKESRSGDFAFAVLELGTDKIGEIAQFDWLKPDVAVVTAIAPEHMEAFVTLDTVAKEELTVASFTKKTFVNRLMVDEVYTKDIEANYYDKNVLEDFDALDQIVHGEHSKDALASAVVVAREIGMDNESIIKGLEKFKPQPGRMNKLAGIKGSTIIDDTYNASPEAMKAALDYVYEAPFDHRVVLLGNMNELGEMSEQAHREVGTLCDPARLQMILTLGKDANAYLADEAEKRGCSVKRFENPYDAGQAIKEYIQSVEGEVLVLCKGSQNGVFAEEAVKILLENPEDVSRLVRQSADWIAKKEKSFTKGRP